MGKKYGSKDKKEGYLKKNSDYCLVIKNSTIMSRIQSGPSDETLHTIETVQLCRNQSYQIVEWE